MAKINIQLLNGTITEIIEDSYVHEGCPTCDFGKSYVNEISFIVEVNRYTCPQKITLTTRGEKGYSESLNLGNIIMLMSHVIENDVSFDGFIYLCRTKLNKDGDVKLSTSEIWID